jgi:hypothetical protein
MFSRSATRFGLRRSAVKPRGARQEVDWGHPLSRDLRVYIPLTEGRGLPMEVVSRSYPDSLSGITYVEQPTGGQNGWLDSGGDLTALLPRRYWPIWYAAVTAVNDGLTWSDARVGLANIDQGKSSQLTAAMIVVPRALGGGGAPHWFSKHNGTDTGWSLGLNSSNVPSFHCGDALNDAVVPTTAVVGEPLAIIGRLRFPRMDVRAINLRTGAIETGTDVWNSGTQDPTSDIPLRLGPRTSSTQSRASFSVAAMWKRALSDNEIDEWLDNPWAMLSQVGTRRWFLPTVAAPPPEPTTDVAAVIASSYGKWPGAHNASRVHPGRSGVLNRAHPIAQGLKFYTAFQENFAASPNAVVLREMPYTDRANQHALITSTSGVIHSPFPSRTGPAVRFTGVSNNGIFGQTVALGATPAVNAIRKQITVACKFKGTDTGTGMFVKSAGNHLRDHFDMRINAFSVDNGSISATGNYADDAWHTAFGQWDGQQIIFIHVDENGQLRERVATAGIAGDLGQTGERICIGGLNTSFSGWTGDIEWVGVWDRILSLQECIALGGNPYLFFLSPSRLRPYVVPAEAPVAPAVISPSGIASAEAFGTPRLQGAILPTAIASAEAFGVHALVDAATTIAPSGIASAEAFGLGEVVGEAGAAGTITLGAGITSGEAFGTAVVTEDATIRPTGIPSAEDLDNPTVRPPLGTINPFGIASEEAFSQVSAGGGINGGIVVVTPTNPATPLAGTVTSKKLCSPVGLIRAEVTNTALDGAVILPDVYGDFSVGGLRGPCPAVLVNDSSPFIFVAAAHPVKEITKVYIDDVEQTSGFATVSAVDLGTGFQVAVIAFTTQPTGQVTWRGKGRMDDAQVLITNPIDQLETLLRHRCGWHTDDFDASTLAEAKSAATAAGWTTAWVFQDDRQVQDWITEVMFNVMGFWRVSGRAQLQLTLDPGGVAFPRSDLVDSIVASRDCVDGDDGVAFTADRQHLVNKLEAYYLHSWSLDQASSRLTDLQDEISVNAYGELRKSVTLRGHRDSAQVEAWADILFQRQGFGHRVEGATVSFAVKGSRLIHATVGDLLAFTWPYGPQRESGNRYINQILRILAISHDFAKGGVVQITAVDTGAFVTDGSTRLLTPLAL